DRRNGRADALVASWHHPRRYDTTRSSGLRPGDYGAVRRTRRTGGRRSGGSSNRRLESLVGDHGGSTVDGYARDGQRRGRARTNAVESAVAADPNCDRETRGIDGRRELLGK